MKTGRIKPVRNARIGLYSIGHSTALFRKVAILMNIPIESVC